LLRTTAATATVYSTFNVSSLQNFLTASFAKQVAEANMEERTPDCGTTQPSVRHQIQIHEMALAAIIILN